MEFLSGAYLNFLPLAMSSSNLSSCGHYFHNHITRTRQLGIFHHVFNHILAIRPRNRKTTSITSLRFRVGNPIFVDLWRAKGSLVGKHLSEPFLTFLELEKFLSPVIDHYNTLFILLNFYSLIC